MVNFSNPLLLLLIPLAGLTVWRWLRRPRAALRYPDIQALAPLKEHRRDVALWTSAGLRGAVLVLIVTAMAGPRWPDRRTRITTEGIAVQMVVDNSGSMAEKDFDW